MRGIFMCAWCESQRHVAPAPPSVRGWCRGRKVPSGWFHVVSCQFTACCTMSTRWSRRLSWRVHCAQMFRVCSFLRVTARLHCVSEKKTSQAHVHSPSRLVTARGSDGSIVFGIVAKSFFLCQQDNSSAALSVMKFCTNMYLDNFYKPFEYQDHKSKVKVTRFFL